MAEKQWISSDDVGELPAEFQEMALVGKGDVPAGQLDLENPPPMEFSTDTDDSDYDIGFVNLKILQRTTPEVEQEEGRSGEIFLEGIGVLESPVTLIPLARAQSRIMKEDKRRINSDIVCRSSNAHVGFGDPGGDCSKCPFSKGSAHDTPDCSHIITYVMYVPSEDAVARINFQRTSLRAARNINTQCRGKNFGEVAIQLTTRQTGTAPETYYAPVIKRGVIPEDCNVPVFE